MVLSWLNFSILILFLVVFMALARLLTLTKYLYLYVPRLSLELLMEEHTLGQEMKNPDKGE